MTACMERYRFPMPSQIKSGLKSKKERREVRPSAPAGIHGVTEGFDPHMLHVTSMAKNS